MERKIKVSIIDNQDRNVLKEGRNYGLGYAFLKKVGAGKYETVQPISPCKNYLNDVVVTEHTGIPISAHGLVYKEKQGIFNGFYSYLAAKICQTYGNFEVHKKNLAENYKNLQVFINKIEELMKFRRRTTLIMCENDLLFIKAPKEWSSYTYMISLYTLFMRVGMWYKEGDVFEYLKTCKEFIDDHYNINSALPKFKEYLEKGFPKQDLMVIAKLGGGYVHGCGIVSFEPPIETSYLEIGQKKLEDFSCLAGELDEIEKQDFNLYIKKSDVVEGVSVENYGYFLMSCGLPTIPIKVTTDYVKFTFNIKKFRSKEHFLAAFTALRYAVCRKKKDVTPFGTNSIPSKAMELDMIRPKTLTSLECLQVAHYMCVPSYLDYDHALFGRSSLLVTKEEMWKSFSDNSTVNEAFMKEPLSKSWEEINGIIKLNIT